MNTTDAAHAVVHDYPGGSESLGPRVGITPAVLRNKVNPNQDGKRHHLTLAEASRITSLTGDLRILKAWANEAGFLLVKTPEGLADDGALVEKLINIDITKGALMSIVGEALADGQIDPEEMQQIRQGGIDAKTTIATAVLFLERLVP